MKKWVHIAIDCISIIILILLLVNIFGFASVLVAFKVPDFDEVSRYFEKHSDDLMIVSDFLKDAPSSRIDLDSENASIIIYSDDSKEEINNLAIKKILKKLKRKGLDTVTKDGESIFFILGSNLDSSSGIRYLDLEREEENYEVIKKKLNDNGWFYYKEIWIR